MESRGVVSEYGVQLWVLMKKNWWLSIANLRPTVIQLLSPFLFMILLFVLQQLYNHDQREKSLLPQPLEVGDISHCQTWNGRLCHTLLYTIKQASSALGEPSLETGNYSLAHEIIESLATSNKWVVGTNLTALNDSAVDVVPMPNFNFTYEYILAHPNQTQAAIVFNYDGDEFLGYNLLYNSSITLQEELNPRRLPLHVSASYIRAIDEAILRVFTGNPDARIEVNSTGYPESDPRFVSNSVVSNGGAFWFYCPPMFTFMILVDQIVSEKEKRLRLGMRTMGLKDSMFWLSWFFTSCILQAISILIMFASGAAFQFAFFTNTNFAVNFISFFLFGISMVPLAFFVSTFNSTTKTANNVAFIIFIIGLLLQIIFSSFAIYIWWSDIASSVWRKVFMFYPPFNFAKCFADTAQRSSPVFNATLGEWVSGPGYYWRDIYNGTYVELFNVTAPPLVQSWYYLLMNLAIFSVLAWFADNVMPQENGTSRPLWFLFTPSYWGIRSRVRRLERAVDAMAPLLSEHASPEVASEAERTLRNGDDPHVPVRIVNLTQVFRKWAFCSSAEDVTAVNRLTFSIAEGQVFCLLGHNGAGKTTTINILTGLMPPSSGDAWIYGLSVSDEQDRIRRILGVCPQHDILWGELTAAQHLEIFAQFKAVPSSEVAALVESKLREVELSHVGNHRVETFSGGMKRRLSVAISSIGEPRMIFFDEPTTGLDPVSRRRVWKLIEKLKQGRVIVLTTHAMDEADLLSDRIGIMAEGRLKCIGTSLELKNQYGEGYRLSLIAVTGEEERLTKELANRLPSSKLVSSDGGSLTCMLPLTNLPELPALLTYFDSPEGKKLVKDWGISHTTLEEVFHNVSQDSRVGKRRTQKTIN